MKKVLILVVSADVPPYDKMIQTSLNTWDSVNVEGVETIYYCGKSNKTNTDKIVYLAVDESLHNMGYKCLQAFELALKTKDFDYVARVNSSCFVDKKELINYIQSLPDNNVFAGVAIPESENTPAWMWGGGQFILSKDVVQKIVDNKEKWDHSIMEDLSLSYMATLLGVPYYNGNACSINQTPNGWMYITYGTGNNFESKNIVKAQGQFFYRVKQDGNRSLDEYIMNQLHATLNRD